VGVFEKLRLRGAEKKLKKGTASLEVYDKFSKPP
jgi:hypothetical protein